MGFYDRDTFLTIWRRAGFDRTVSESAILQRVAQRSDSTGGKLYAAASYAWMSSKHVYYKVSRPLARDLVHTKLTPPAGLLKLPYSALLIRLPVGHGISALCDDAIGEIKTALVWDAKTALGRNGVALCVFIQGTSGQCCQTLTCPTDETILDDARDASGLVDGAPLAILRVACGVAFLATGADKLVESDVLKCDIVRYYEGSDQDKERLVEKARRRGNFGFVVGARERDYPRLQSDADRVNGEPIRSLRYQHQRCGHFHVVRFGPGRENAEVKYFRQMTVRPDLPPAPDERPGYRPRTA